MKKAQKAKSTPPKPKSAPVKRWLPSKQWQSESSLGRSMPPPNSSGSGSGSPSNTIIPPDPCTGTPPKSVKFKEKKTIVINEAPPGGGLGLTKWTEEPTFEFDAFCDGKRKVWTCRVTTATGQQTQWIGTPSPLLTDNAISGTTDCSLLERMRQQLQANIDRVTPISGWCPKDLVRAHENVHRDLASHSATNRYSQLVARIEAISFPCKDASDSVDARKAMDTAIFLAKAQFDIDFLNDFRDNQGHKPKAPFKSAMERAGSAWLARILSRKNQLNCPP